MNLLLDPWIPVVHKGSFKQIGLKGLLCSEDDQQLSCHRDDTELAALQLVISLVQVIFTPRDAAELKRRVEVPLTEAEYKSGIFQFSDMFILNHPKYPFMQTRGVKAQELTPMQKLFIGLPEGNNHAFFNETGEITATCPSCTAITLFNQASNCPSFGGGFKGTLRGAAPITTLVYGETLRGTIWKNIIDRETVERILPDSESRNDKPVWMLPVQAGETVYAHKIGISRGLFWQPAHVEVMWAENGLCDACGMPSSRLASGFMKEKFAFELNGVWPHPHGPRAWKIENGERRERFASFRITAPTWTQLNEFLILRESEEGGQIPAAVISRFTASNPYESLSLIVGGYRSDRASVLQRKHETVSLSSGWAESMQQVESVINLALDIIHILRSKLYGFGKKLKMDVSGLAIKAEELYYQNSETLIHRKLRTMNWKEFANDFNGIYEELRSLAIDIFEEITASYRHDLKIIKAAVTTRRTLAASLYKLKPSI